MRRITRSPLSRAQRRRADACTRRRLRRILSPRVPQTVRDQCFQKCITRPGSSMSNSEVQCLANCCDRYIDVRAPNASPPFTRPFRAAR